jgi:hypothetical protein
MASISDATKIRGNRLWQRLQEIYGARLAESYGTTIPEPWLQALALRTEQDIRRALQAVRYRHASHPPTLGEFEALLKPPAEPIAERGRSQFELMNEYVARTYGHRMSAMQLCSRRNFHVRPTSIVTAEGRPSTAYELLGCTVPADPVDPVTYPAIEVSAVAAGLRIAA